MWVLIQPENYLWIALLIEQKHLPWRSQSLFKEASNGYLQWNLNKQISFSMTFLLKFPGTLQQTLQQCVWSKQAMLDVPSCLGKWGGAPRDSVLELLSPTSVGPLCWPDLLCAGVWLRREMWPLWSTPQSCRTLMVCTCTVLSSLRKTQSPSWEITPQAVTLVLTFFI